MAEKTWALTDLAEDVFLDQITLGPDQVGGSAAGYSVTKRTLQGGLRQGVDVIEVDNGLLRFIVVPTRGIGIWKATVSEMHLGWKSPLARPVHPSMV